VDVLYLRRSGPAWGAGQTVLEGGGWGAGGPEGAVGPEGALPFSLLSCSVCVLPDMVAPEVPAVGNGCRTMLVC